MCIVTFCLLNTHFSDIPPNQREDRILPTCLDECSWQVDAPKIVWLNMRLPEDGAVVCRNTTECNVM
jgi:hypothetical protein